MLAVAHCIVHVYEVEPAVPAPLVSSAVATHVYASGVDRDAAASVLLQFILLLLPLIWFELSIIAARGMLGSVGAGISLV